MKHDKPSGDARLRTRLGRGSVRVALAWTGALVVAVALSSAVVANATGRVRDPLTTIELSEASATPSAGPTEPTEPGDSPASSTPTPTTEQPGTDTTDAPTVTPHPVLNATPTSRPTSAPTPKPSARPTANPTATPSAPDDDPAPVAAQTQTVRADGGTARFRMTADRIELEYATPAAGFAAEITRDGPFDVRVEFVSASHTSRIDADREDGQLRVRVREESDNE